MKLSIISFRIKELVKYYLRADTIYNIHSPLVYNLAEQIFRKEVYKNSFCCIEEIRKQCIIDKNIISIVDHGAGSMSYSGNHTYRTLSSIVNTAVSMKGKCILLYRIVRFFKPDTILELGASLGISTLYLAKAAPESKILTIEGDPVIASYASRHFKQCGAKLITLVSAKIEDVLSTLLCDYPNINLIYVDAHHSYASTIKYFQEILRVLKDVVLIFDDIYWSAEMKKAWEDIKNDTRVSITIDLYQMGVVVIRTGLSKQNFTLIDYKYKPFRFGIFAPEINNQ